MYRLLVSALPAVGVLTLVPDNLVARPWGGTRLFEFKRLGNPPPGVLIGESFEVSADPGDVEAAAHPSFVMTPRGRPEALTELLLKIPELILGHGQTGASPRIPILPKFLDVRQLLSVQTHPPESPEVYLVLEAAPEATVRLGFRNDVDLGAFAARVAGGRRAQEGLLSLVRDAALLQSHLEPWLSARRDDVAAVARALAPAAVREATVLLRELAEVYRFALDALNEIEAPPGRVLVNFPLHGGSADIHALGNPEGRGILVLEIRCPGPTLRAWDHGRFPLRPLEIDRALAVVDGRRREPATFVATPESDGPGVRRLAACAAFAAFDVEASLGERVHRPAHAGLRTLHVIAGAVVIHPGAVSISRGHSALIPAALGEYTIEARDDRTRLVEVVLSAPG